MKYLNNLILDVDMNDMSAMDAIEKYGFYKHVPFTYTEDSESSCPYEEYVCNQMLFAYPHGATVRVNEVTIRIMKDESCATLQALNFDGEDDEYTFASIR